MAIPLVLLVAYVALAMYAGFWYALNEIPHETSTGDKLLLVWITVCVMPVVIPLGVIVGIYRMLAGVTIVLYVDEVEQDGTSTQHHIVMPWGR